VEPFAVGPWLVVPYRPFVGSTSKNDRILAECVAHPERFTLPMTRDDIRTTAAWYLTDPNNLAYEVWRAGSLVGIFLLDRIVPAVDARWHFVFFDGELVGKLALLHEFLRRLFDALALQRITLEAPVNAVQLISFARRKLGFRYEGENRMSDKPVSMKWAAGQGSRRERSYLSASGEWLDVVCLRLLVSEYSPRAD
jgi:RimJ/RimL family protein N-acetyltransferase